jgi:hypothetical protein
MKVADLVPGELYNITPDKVLTGKMGSTPLEEASRLALYVLKRKHHNWQQIGNGPIQAYPTDPAVKLQGEPWVYLGQREVYGGRNGNQVVYDKVHHFIRPNGKRLYIYGEHIKHITPFTSTETVPTV